MAYMGLSLFIIRRALRIYGCMHVYAYNLTWGGLKNGKNWGRAKRVLSPFCRIEDRSFSFWNSTFKFQLFAGDFLLIPPCLFTVHVRPVLSPCQAGNTCYTLTFFQTF